MSRPAKGARLWLRQERRDPKTGKLRERSAWVIRDGAEFISTGCLPGQVAKAEACLAAYIEDKQSKKAKPRDIEIITIDDVLTFYVAQTRERQANKAKLDERINRLRGWWGRKTLAEVNGETCLAYVASRGASTGGARRDLQDLRAAIKLHGQHNRHREDIDVVLPAKGLSRERWLTRDEAAKLLITCWRYRETQTWKRGTRAGKTVQTDKRPLRHIARFILIGLYTGTRAGAIAAASPTKETGRSWVDLDAGRFYRLARGKRATNKRQPPVRLSSRLVAHMRRWKIGTHFVEWNGKPVQSVKVGFASAVKRAGLCTADGPVTPHTLRHTAATWLMQTGSDIKQIAHFLGMSQKMLEEVYGHHHPDFQEEVAESFSVRSRRTKPKEKVGIPVGDEQPPGSEES